MPIAASQGSTYPRAAAGMARVIRALPTTMIEEKRRLIQYVKAVLDGCLAHQREDGLFHDVVDDSASFVETNLAQMVAYTIYRGVQGGWLDAAYLAIAQHRPLPLGRYLLLRNRRDEAYWTYQAVVHDLEAQPTCRAGYVRRSLTAILAVATKRGMSTLAVEPLGMFRTDGLTVEEMVEAFDASILETARGLTAPVRLVLLLEQLDDLEEVSHLLRERLLRKSSRSFRTVDGEAALVEIRQRSARLHCRFVPGSLSGYVVTRVDHAL